MRGAPGDRGFKSKSTQRLLRHSCARGIGVALIGAGTAWCLAAPATAEWKNSLVPAGTVSAPLTLVRDGKPLYAVVLPEQPTGPERKAADDLRQWVKEITGAELPSAKGGGNAPAIRIRTAPEFVGDEYRIAVEADSLVLTGGTGRGAVNAVYALLEEDLGCRWYVKDDSRLPKTATLTVPVVPRSYRPSLRMRDPFYAASFDPVWSLRNRTNAPRAAVAEEHGGHLDYGGLDVHTHATLLPADKHFKDHPEYFAQDASGKRYPAQLCATHPEVARIVSENILDLLRDKPHTEIVSVSKNDNGGDQICHCTTCAPLRNSEGGTDMANQLVLVNRIAEVVEKHHPAVLIDTLAYLETINVPKTIRPRKNVVIRLCNDSVGAWSTPFKPARNCPVAKVVQAWSAAHDRLSIWDYNVNFSHYLAPMPNLAIIADNIRFWIEHKAIGLLTQGGYQSTSERDQLRSWVIAKLMWDSSRDVDALVNDFVYGHYDAAAPALAAYESLLQRTAEKHAATLAAPAGGIRYPMDVPFLGKEFLDEATAVFANAVQLARGDERLLHKVERAELPILYVKLARGPQFVGGEYGAVLDRFERISRREGVRYLAEGAADFDAKIAAWRAQAKAAAAPPPPAP